MKTQSLNAFLLNFNARVSFIGSNKCVKSAIQCEKDSFEKIDFITPSLSRQTFEKARNIVMQSIAGEEPRESIVLIKEDEVLFQATGDETEVEIPEEVMEDISASTGGGLIIVHSHTPEYTGLTAPLSLTDVGNLIDNDNIKCVCAVNNKGEFSVIEKIPGKKYTETISESMDNKFCAGFVKLFNGKKKKEYEKFLYTINDTFEIDNANFDSYYIHRMLTLQDELDEYYDYAVSLKEFPEYTDDFWKNNANDFGFRYYSNFSF